MEKSKRLSNIKVLMYHRVIESKPRIQTHWHYVSIVQFRTQMKIIDKLGFTPITFSDYQLYQEEKLTLPKKPIIITFDDGYLDTFQNAIPILQEFDMKAVIFVMGNRRLNRARWDELDQEDVCELMTDEQIRMAKNLEFEIGAHSLNHISLVGLSDKEVEFEIQQSKYQIESILNTPIHTFAYPYGILDNRVSGIVSESGFSFACGVYSGSPKYGETKYDIRRLAINHNTSMLGFIAKLLLPYQYVEWLYHRAKSGRETQKKYSSKRASTNGQAKKNASYTNPVFEKYN